MGVAGVRIAAAGVGVVGVVGVAGVAGVAGVRVAGEAEGELGDNRVAVDVDGAALGGVGATQPPMSETSNATVTRRAAGCRGVLMLF